MRKHNTKKWTVDSGQWTGISDQCKVSSGQKRKKKLSLTTQHLSLATNNSGMALIIVVAIVAILSAIGITFMYEMRMEEKASFNYISSLKASYIAKAGIEHAIAVLKSDGGDTGFDAYNSDKWGYDTDLNGSVFSAYNNNDSVDNDSFLGTFSPNCNSGLDSRWIYVTDDNGDTVGRYAVLILDESSKININTAGYRDGWDNSSSDPRQGWGTFEISLADFLEAGRVGLGWKLGASAQTLAQNILNYQYSPEGAPGKKNYDDDGDSIIWMSDGIDHSANGNIGDISQGVDDPYEFVSWLPYYDPKTLKNYNTPFITNEEIKNVTDIGDTTFKNIKPYITVYSSDENTTDSGFLRMNINLVKDAMALYTVMYDAWKGLGYDYGELKRLASQVAVNTIDYADTDNVSTFLEITSDDGSETTIARGVEAIRINEIMVKPAYQWEAEELFKKNLVLPVTKDGWHPDLDTPDTFIYSTTPGAPISANIEPYRPGYYRVRVLSYDDGDTIIVGPDPKTDTALTDNSFDVSISDENGNNIFQRTAGEQYTGGWLLDDLGVIQIKEPITGKYTVKLTVSNSVDCSGKASGSTGTNNTLIDDKSHKGYDWAPGQWKKGAEIKIIVDGEVKQIRTITDNTVDTVTVDKNWDENPTGDSQYEIRLKNARVDYIQLSQQPDCEYVELVNISDNDINIRGWTLTTSGGWVGTIPDVTPDGTIIHKYKAGSEQNYLVLVVDKDDSMWLMFEQQKDPNVPKEMNDNICFENTWPRAGFDRVVPLQLSTAPVNIAEQATGDSIILRGSIFEDSPLHIPPNKQREDYGTATPANSVATNNTLQDTNKHWDTDQWKGATITAMIEFATGDSQITRQIIGNDANRVTISGKWLWDGVPVSASNYYIFFTPMAVTLWEGPLADRKIVAQVNYLASDIQDTPCYTQTDGIKVYGFVALEKNDPTAIYDRDEDGIDDSWLFNKDDEEPITIGGNQLPGGSPGGKNSVVPDDKYPGENIKVRNLPFATIGDIKEVSRSDTSFEWSRLGYDTSGKDDIDAIKMLADKITVSEKRLEAENGYYPTEVNDWTDTDPQGIFLTHSYYVDADDSVGTWWWGLKDRIHTDTGFYSLYIKGMIESDSGLVEVTVTTATEAVTRPLTFTPDGTAYFGQIQIGGGMTTAPLVARNNLQDLLAVSIKKENAGTKKAYFDAVILAPEYRTYGVININTADTVVLQALPGITPTIAEAIVAHRESPDSKKGPFKNIGEILNVEDSSNNKVIDLNMFSKISNLITTKSKIFTIISTGQALRKSDRGDVTVGTENYEILGEKKYMVVTER